MIILGVVMTEHIGFEMHIKRICVQARQSMYALRIMTTHGPVEDRGTCSRFSYEDRSLAVWREVIHCFVSNQAHFVSEPLRDIQLALLDQCYMMLCE